MTTTGGRGEPWPRVLGQTLVVLAASTVLAAIVNQVRDDGIPWRMPFPPEYQCPSLVAPGTPISVAQALEVFGRDDIAWVDARSPEAFARGHVPGAMNIPYSFIEPVPDEAVQRLRPYETVIVYCNTEGNERSERMAGELTLAGAEGVTYLEGGLLEWLKAGGAFEGERPQTLDPLFNQ